MDLQFNVTVTGWEEENVEDVILSRASSKLVDLLEDKVNARIDALIDETAKAVIEERIRGEIATIIDSGWEITDSYGRSSGKRVTLADRVNEALKKPTDSYSRRSYFLAECIDRTIKDRFDKTVDDGTKRLKEKIDEVINGTIEETITGEIRSKIRGALAKN